MPNIFLGTEVCIQVNDPCYKYYKQVAVISNSLLKAKKCVLFVLTCQCWVSKGLDGEWWWWWWWEAREWLTGWMAEWLAVWLHIHGATVKSGGARHTLYKTPSCVANNTVSLSRHINRMKK